MKVFGGIRESIWKYFGKTASVHRYHKKMFLAVFVDHFVGFQTELKVL